MIAPPMPWKARERSSCTPVCEIPQRSEPNVKMPTPIPKIRLRP